MLPNLDEQRAERRNASEAAAEARKRGYARARLGFKLLAAPFVFGLAYMIYSCGYYVGWMAALASVAK